jgi:putative DNA primase/helicase
MTELANLMYVDKFIDRLDERHNLLGFNNGIYDLDAGVFRDGLIDDMVSMSVGYDYTDIVDKKIRDGLMEFFTSIQDTEEIRDYLLDTMAIDLYGDIKKKEWIVFWIGNGGNGKSIVALLQGGAFGDYMYNPAIEIFTTKKKSSSQANPELAMVKGKRATITTEPEEDETILVGLLKKWTGGDKIQARMLYGKPVEFVSQSKPTIQSNFKCLLSSADGGTARRLRKIRFPFKFVENPTGTNERLIDLTIGDRFKEQAYHQQFMLLLLERFKVIKENNFKINTPKRVLEDTKEYLNENNHILNFVDETMEQKTDGKVLLKDAYMEFKMWVKGCGLNANISQSAFKEGMIGLGYEVKKQRGRDVYRDQMCIYGVIFRSIMIKETDDYD